MSIKVNNISFTYMKKTPNEFKALDGVSFEIPTGSYTTIIGHTGSGKSTLVQMFNALLTPDEGTIDINGNIITNKMRGKEIINLRKRVGLVFQFPEYQLFEETVEKDVAFGLVNFGVDKNVALEQSRKVLLELGFNENIFTRSPFDLSGGERRKVALAGILVLKPEILILDEPTAGLDPKSAKEILNLINKLHSEGTTVVVVTHDMDIVFKYSTQVLVINHGNLVYNGTCENLFEDNNDYNIEIPKMFEFLTYLKKNGVVVPSNKSKTTDDIIEYLSSVRRKS